MTKTAPRKTRKRAKEYLRLSRKEGYNWGFIKAVLSSNSDTAIVTMQDLLGLGNEARMNYPSTVVNNWQWHTTNVTVSGLDTSKTYAVFGNFANDSNNTIQELAYGEDFEFSFT
jgi:4-alpha-glucanotransferase